MKMKYQAIYKCRMCGEEYGTCFGGKEIGKIKILLMCTGKQDPQVGEKDLHECSDGNIGLADFQGFKAVEE